MQPDFQRDVYCVLGLPFDAVSEAGAADWLQRAVSNRVRCFFSTPNLNFAVACLRDGEFRASVLQSDLSLADGWPIVAIAHFLGVPLPERVAGSSLFERLGSRSTAAPIKVYFFGGPDGAAEAACVRLNSSASGLRCAGFDAPGFGTIEEMSDTARLDRLNAADADFVVVALGAKKGQAWIQHNLSRISAPLVCHLGAVVNFAAGTIARAPTWVQNLRLEWLWRMKEEPALWRRYARDGWALLYWVIARVLPLALALRLARPSQAALSSAQVVVESTADRTTIRLEGPWVHGNLQPLRDVLQAQMEPMRPLALDLAKVSYLDSSAVGLLMLVHGWNLRLGSTHTVTDTSRTARRMLRWAGAEYLLGCADDASH